jgi:hypothetical protein
MDALMTDYPRHGTWPGYRQIAHLVVVEDTICSSHNHSPLHIPPYGIVAMDVEFGKTE